MLEGLHDFWYAVEHASSLGPSPRQVTLLAQKYILFRDEKGLPRAAYDRCPHRSASFKNGWVESGCLHCPYHGFSFNAEGQCVHVPVDQPGTPIPSLAKLKILSAFEKAGFIWLFPGAIENADPNLIPDFPEFGDPGWRAVQGEYEWDANFSRVVEATLDTSHAPFVHKTFFANRDEAAIHPLEVVETDRSVSCFVNTKPPKRTGLFRLAIRREIEHSTSWMTCYLPSLNRLDVHFNMKGYRFIYVASNIPLSSTRTLTKWIEVRNFVRQPFADHQFLKDTTHTYHEDRSVVETQDKGLTWDLEQRELLLASDRLILAYRKKMAALLSGKS
ncbi:aromatic ring-hydroxylating dioxygenase subunit alpha [Cyanobium sp. Morenito 9A2]|uniref:aromatic ring-hydroxylating dioxygenase subunit alpha n=1 Tax=Cyanobium sp. Morenito 9A2 TaxID=2823718 RepID=UPI0020CC886B|nr:aromatic ring-hydroxylating dioxygenase subunit alpha [Cyanobium sp. Morenito 9A2]MCP9849913.1 aromatic ring-hydroxylating dioxygenase subunit alpha [Cyanobium sp. Morenito 9A2]